MSKARYFITMLALSFICSLSLIAGSSNPRGSANTTSHTIQLSAGWNLVSLPAVVPDARKSTLFPMTSSQAFIYDGRYIPKDTLTNGKAFWIKFSAPTTVDIIGETTYDDTIDVQKGWNMIGGLSMPVPVSSIHTLPDSLIVSSIFSYAPGAGYRRVDTLQPGLGYWIKTKQSGKIILASYTLQPDLVVLSDTINKHIISIGSNSDSLVVDTAMTNILPGQILVSDVGDGLLRKVIQVQQNGNQTIILTSQASLADVFTDASISDSFAITQDMVRELRNPIRGIKQIKSLRPNELKFSFEDAVLWDQDHNPNTTGDQVTVSGSLSIQLKPRLEIKIQKGQLKRFVFSVEPTTIIELNADVPLEIPIVDDSIKIFTIRTTPITFFAGPVPVVVTNDIPIYLGLDGKVRVSLTAGIKNTTGVLLGVKYEDGAWTSTSNFNNQFEYTPPSISGDVNVQLYVKPQLETKLYGIIGPITHIKGYAEGDASVTLNLLNGDVEDSVGLFAGIQAGVGVTLSIFDIKLTSWESPLLVDFKEKLWGWDTVYHHATVTPSLPQPADSATGQPNSLKLSWSCTNPYHLSLSYDVYFGTDNPPMTVVSSDQTDTTLVRSGLSQGTTYYWKVVAKDNHGKSTSGPVWRFTTQSGGGSHCPGAATVDYGGKTYHTVQIGNQCWLKENLDIGTMILKNQVASDNSVIEKYCNGNDSANCEIYGGLYQWNEAMQYDTSAGGEGICPSGWHIPTQAEFQTLSNTVGWDANALKATGQGIWSGAGTNTSGFSALPGGYLNYSTLGFTINVNTLMWSSSTANVPTAKGFHLDSHINFYNDDINDGFSVRCLKD